METSHDTTPRPAPRQAGAHSTPAALFSAHLAGDPEALTSLTRRLTPMMTAVARRYLGRSHDAEDAVQDAWIQFLRYAARIHSPEALPGWLKATTAHCAINIGKRRHRCVPTAAWDGYERPAEQDDVEMLDDDGRQAVAGAVERLRDDHRELIELLFVSELTYDEVTVRTGRPTGWIGPTRGRALTRLGRDRAVRDLRALAS